MRFSCGLHPKSPTAGIQVVQNCERHAMILAICQIHDSRHYSDQPFVGDVSDGPCGDSLDSSEWKGRGVRRSIRSHDRAVLQVSFASLHSQTHRIFSIIGCSGNQPVFEGVLALSLRWEPASAERCSSCYMAPKSSMSAAFLGVHANVIEIARAGRGLPGLASSYRA